MKTLVTILLIVAFGLLVAQPEDFCPPPCYWENPPRGLDCDCSSPVPIDSYWYVLFGAGMILGVYYYRRTKLNTNLDV